MIPTNDVGDQSGNRGYDCVISTLLLVTIKYGVASDLVRRSGFSGVGKRLPKRIPSLKLKSICDRGGESMLKWVNDDRTLAWQ